MHKLLKNKTTQASIVALLYFLFGKLAFMLSVNHGIVTNAPFFAEGASLAFILFFGYHTAWGVFIGQFVLALSGGLDLVSCLGISTLNSSLAIVGKWLFVRFKFSVDLKNIRDWLFLITLSLFILQPISAIAGNLILVNFNILKPAEIFPSILTWWLGNSIGQIAITPMLLLLFSKQYEKNIIRHILFSLIAFVVTSAFFITSNYIDTEYRFSFLLLLLPVSLFISSKLKLLETVTSLFVTTIAAFYISSNYTRFASGEYVDLYQLDLLILGLQISVILVSVLINNLKETQIKLEKSEEQYRIIAENVSDVIWILNIDKLHFTYISPSIYNLRGFTVEEALAQEIHQALTPESADKIIKLAKIRIQRFIETNENKGYLDQIQQPCKNGDLIWTEIATKYRFNSKGEIEVFGVSRNINERIKLEKKINEQNRILTKLNATKDKFFSIIAHDLRNPFNAILSISKGISSDIDHFNKADIKKYVDTIHESSQTAYKLLENLLVWARSQKNEIPFNITQVSIISILYEEKKLLKQSADNKNITIHFQLKEDILFKADENMIKTIIRNLISNAIKFTPRNGEIWVSAQNKHENITISVKDSGIGMSDETKAKLFNISDKLSTKGTEDENGTGLGLLLCNEFAKRHKGRILVESEPEKGSTFTLILPK